MSNDAEQGRLDEDRNRVALWRRWGPYLSARQWGTVREDYSAGGTAWDFFPHEHARSRAYRWGEDGLGGISDHWQHLCFSVALWNTNDAILKERLFGLTNSEGNHGEDAKEYWWALDSTPTHSYMRWLYKYPQRAFPYARPRRGEPAAAAVKIDEYELVDTGVFEESRYFDVELTYAKARPTTSASSSTRRTAGPRRRRSTSSPRSGSATRGRGDATTAIRSSVPSRTTSSRRRTARSAPAGSSATAHPHLLFCENETNAQRLWGSARTRRRSRRTASTTTSIARRRDRQPGAVRHEGRGLVPLRRARRRVGAASACG